MYNLNQYQKDQVCLLALYHPYPIQIVESVFVMCDKSFDKTEKALELGSAYNSIERGINEANQAARGDYAKCEHERGSMVTENGQEWFVCKHCNKKYERYF